MKKLAIYSIMMLFSCMSFGQTNATLYLQNIQKIHDDYLAASEANNSFGYSSQCLEDSTLIFEESSENLVQKKTYVYNENNDWYFEATLMPDSTSITGYSFISSRWRLFNEDDLPLQIITYFGNAFNGGTPSQKIEFNYNDDGLVSDFLVSNHENGDWVNHRKRIYCYGSGIICDAFMDSAWDNQGWIDYQLTTFMLTTESILLLNDIIVLNPDYTLFNRNQKYEYEFVPNTELIHSITLLLDNSTTNLFDPFLKGTYTYEDELEVEFLFEIYDMDTFAWEDLSRIDKTYVDVDPSHSEILEETFSKEDDNWIFSDLKHHFYTCPSTVATHEIIEHNIQLSYPNPMTDLMEIAITGITDPTRIYIHTMDGRTVFTQEIRSDKTIQLPYDLPQGMYVINLLDSNQSMAAEKFIKL